MYVCELIIELWEISLNELFVIREEVFCQISSYLLGETLTPNSMKEKNIANTIFQNFLWKEILRWWESK